MDSLPTLESLQSALCYDEESEEEILSVIIHLVVCAIEDPGIPNPQKHLTLLGQNLRQADITNTNVSEILRIYLFARAQAEVRMLHGLAPPEMHLKDRSKEALQDPEHLQRVEKYNNLLFETRPHQMSEWVKTKTFLCLNPLDKSEMIAFLCNDLLSNKSVVQQIDFNVENLTRAKKQKWEAEIKVKKYKSIQAKRIREAAMPIVNNQSMIKNDTLDEGSNCANLTPAPTPSNQESETASEVASVIADDDKDGDESIISESTNDATTEKPQSKSGKKGKPTKRSRRLKGKKRKPEDKHDAEPKGDTDNEDTKDQMDECNDDTQSSVADTVVQVSSSVVVGDHLDEDEKLSPEELQKKIDKSIKMLNKRRDELTFVTNCMRCNDMGQDRYRRRYWHLAHGDGIYVEALESAEPWKLETEGLPHTDHDERTPVAKRTKLDDELENCLSQDDIDDEGDMEVDDADVKNVPAEIKSNGNNNYEKQQHGDASVKKESGENKDNVTDIKVETNDVKMNGVKEELEIQRIKAESETEEALKKLGCDILVTSKNSETNDVKLEVSDAQKKFMPKVTPNGDKLNMFNHSTYFNMSLSPVVLNGSVTITPKDPNSGLPGGGVLNVPNPNSSMNGNYIGASEKPWFSILPLDNPIDFNPHVAKGSSSNNLAHRFEHNSSFASPLIPDRIMGPISSSTPINQQIEILEGKLEEIKKGSKVNKRDPIPKLYSYGWWKLNSAQDINELDAALNPRGIREQQLLINLRRNLEIYQVGAKKQLPEDIELIVPEDYEYDTVTNGDSPCPDKIGSWSHEVALRTDKYVLEQLEALEDKVAAASMQIPVSITNFKVDFRTIENKPHMVLFLSTI